MVKYLVFFLSRLQHWYKVRHFIVSCLIRKRSHIISPLWIDGVQNIDISDHVRIYHKTTLIALPLTGVQDCGLSIGKGTIIGHFNHIIATQKIAIGENVLTADRVYISDNLHSYEDINLPIMQQPIIPNRQTTIGDGSWLGENVCILGARVGKHCVIGANSVVTKDIPDYCVAIGSPAHIIKRYNFESSQWQKTDRTGNFI